MWAIPLLPLMFLLPVGRAHVMVLGYAGNALASALVMLILWLLLRISVSNRGKLKFIIIATILLFVLTNTYHTWSTYFAIFGGIGLIWTGISRRLVCRPPTTAERLMVFAPIFWIVAAVYNSNAALSARFVEAITVLHTLSPLESPIGLLLPGTGGPLATYLRREPILSPQHFSLLVALSLFLLLSLWSAIILSRRVRHRGPVAEVVLALVLGTVAVVPALVMLGGPDLAFSRGLEFASVTGPFIIACALTSARGRVNAREEINGPAKATAASATSTRAERMMIILVIFVLANVVASALDVRGLSHDELLSQVEASGVETISKLTPPSTVIWSDDRLGPSFLYYQPKAFITFDLKYDLDEEAKAVIYVFYNSDCAETARYLKGTGAGLALTTSYMSTGGVVRRAAPLVPAPNIVECFASSASQVYDNGAVSVFDLASMYAIYNQARG